MTQRLYYTDASCLTFDARLVDVADEGRRVYLDRTAFYPTSGGQPHDTGTLGGRPVVDVVDEGDRIAHLLADPLDATAGAEVHGAVDAQRRLDHMQQHSGQHLLSAVFADVCDADTVSVHFGPEVSLVELDVADLPRDRLVAVESRANAIVAEARPVTVSFEDAAAAAGLRKPTDRSGVVRIVEIAGMDRSACGGTHVATTAAIGAILVRRAERIRGHLRVEFVCGARAIRRARADHEALSAAAQSLSAAPGDVPALVTGQAERIRQLESARKSLLQTLAEYRARELCAASAPGPTGTRCVTEGVMGPIDDLHRGTAQAMTMASRVVYVATADDPAAILVAASADSGLDAGQLLKAALGKVGGRGGGSARIAQGTAPDASALQDVVAAIRSVAGG